MRTGSELLAVMRDHMLPEEIVEACGITAGELTEELTDWINENFEKVERGINNAGFTEEVETNEEA